MLPSLVQEFFLTVLSAAFPARVSPRLPATACGLIPAYFVPVRSRVTAFDDIVN